MSSVRLSDGTRLRTWTTGTPTARPPVVLLHGGPGLWDYLEPVAAMLDDLTVVHRFDQRGCGGSNPSEEQTMRRLQDDIDELRQHWGHQQIVVLGHSFGARLALTYAAAYPQHVVKVGHFSGVGLGDWRTPYYEERNRRLTPEQLERLTALQASRSPEEETEFRVLSWVTDHADREHAWQWASEDAAVPHPINFAANRALATEINAWSDDELIALVAGLPMPVWLVHGTGDPRPASAVQALARHIPHHEVRLIEGAGHSPWRERPDAFRQVLQEFLAD
ncbi:alpha/beta fold hydrolase [Kribbella sp. CA-294648]|uniref:alpha/beta fold hydrolase n=1 Tax=Kribbella sp. CA-294648 TaxID=3239948 RepID=UPI003D90F2C1